MNMANNKVSEVVAGGKGKTLTPGQELYRARHDLPEAATAFRYLVFSSQRTGSNYLCRRLCNIKDRFGLPSEYLHPKAIAMMSGRLMPDANDGEKIPLGKYLRGLERVRTTADGAFGMKVQPMQILTLVQKDRKSLLNFIGRFDRIVLMTRRDKLGQAISGAIAAQTGKWFDDGKEPELDAAQVASLFPVIAQNLVRYIEEERLILDIGRTISKPLLRIEYEEIEQDGPAAFNGLVDFLTGGQTAGLIEEGTLPVTEKPPGKLAKELRKRFLDYIGGTAKKK
jgi:LPS sulfotransferase NodH